MRGKKLFMILLMVCMVTTSIPIASAFAAEYEPELEHTQCDLCEDESLNVVDSQNAITPFGITIHNCNAGWAVYHDVGLLWSSYGSRKCGTCAVTQSTNWRSGIAYKKCPKCGKIGYKAVVREYKGNTCKHVNYVYGDWFIY